MFAITRITSLALGAALAFGAALALGAPAAADSLAWIGPDSGDPTGGSVAFGLIDTEYPNNFIVVFFNCEVGSKYPVGTFSSVDAGLSGLFVPIEISGPGGNTATTALAGFPEMDDLVFMEVGGRAAQAFLEVIAGGGTLRMRIGDNAFDLPTRGSAEPLARFREACGG